MSQPLLSVAGDSPTLFTFAGVRGGDLVVVALLVALVPPLLLWSVTVGLGWIDRRAGDAAAVMIVGSAVGLAAIQLVKGSGVEREALVGFVGLTAAVGFGFAYARVGSVRLWTRYAAPLPFLAIALMLGASPSGELLRGPRSGGSPVEAAEGTPPVVFLMFDELPLVTLLADDEEIDAERFPNFARLAERSTWYRDFTSMAEGTTVAVPAALTGQEPRGGPPLWTSRPDNLFSLLVDTHRLTVSETVTQLCGYSTCGIEGSGSDSAEPGGVRSVMRQLRDVWLQRVRLSPVDDVDMGQFEEEPVLLEQADRSVDAPEMATEEEVVARPQRFSDFLDSLAPTADPHLYYLHLMLPHQPWTYYPDGERYHGYSLLEFQPEPSSSWTLARAQQAHTWQTQYADRLLGQVLDRLEDSGLFDRSLIVVTADHGLDLNERAGRVIRSETLVDIAYVPLLVKSPGQVEGMVDRSNLMAVDLLPTIADELGVEVGWEVDGFAAGSPEIGLRDGAKRIYAGWNAEERFDFHVDEAQPTVDRNFVPPALPGEGSLDGLMRYLGVEGEIGRSIDDHTEVADGTSALLSRPFTDEGSRDEINGRISGHVRGARDGDLLLVALDGVVGTASVIRDGGSFDTFLPYELVDLEGGADVNLVLFGPEGARRIEIID